MTTIIHRGTAGNSRLVALENAAVASIEAAWACEALDRTEKTTPVRQGNPNSRARSAAKAWKVAGMAWHTLMDPPSTDSPNGELGLALKASGRALMRTCTTGLEPAQEEALQAWEAAKTAWNTHAAGPEATIADPLAEG